MLNLSVTVTDGFKPELLRFVGGLAGEEMRQLNEVGGRSATNAAAKYHREFDAAGRWTKNPKGAEPKGFGADVARAWNFRSSSPEGAEIGNDQPIFAHKVTGGTIVPKRAKALTIPLIDEARGRRARDYEIYFRTRLFTIKGKSVLFERTSESEIVGARGRRQKFGATIIRRRGGIRAVFALAKSVTQGPWPGAMPPDKVLIDGFTDGWESGLDRLLENFE